MEHRKKFLNSISFGRFRWHIRLICTVLRYTMYVYLANACQSFTLSAIRLNFKSVLSSIVSMIPYRS